MKNRFLFKKIYDHLTKKQIALLIGARQVGKTTLLKELNKTLKAEDQDVYYLTLENPDIVTSLDQHPDKLFDNIPPISEVKPTFILIDEIQYLKNPSNFLKYHYDQYNDKIKFVVSGSSSFYIDQKFTDSLAGRKRIFEMYTLSFEEFLYFKERDDLIPQINTGKLPIVYKAELRKLMNEYIIYGGYPEIVLEEDIKEKQNILKEIGQSYVKKDAVEANVKYPELYLNLMAVLAEQSGSLFNAENTGRDLSVSGFTIESYITIMMRSFHITKVKPFYRSIAKEIRRMPKIYFNDLGLRNYFNKDFSPIASRDDKGNLFENFVFRRLLDRNDSDDIKFWRTQKKQEVDFVVSNKKAFEVKFNKSGYRTSKYKQFKDAYPAIPLELIHFENALEIKY